MFNSIPMELYLASKLIENVISGRVQFARYISALIALRYGTFRPSSSSLSSLELKGHFSFQMNKLPWENLICPYQRASRLSLYMLTNGLIIHLESVQSIG